MPTTRKRKLRTGKPLKAWELALLTGDDSNIHTVRDAARLKCARADPDGWLIFGDRTARQLRKKYPEQIKKNKRKTA